MEKILSVGIDVGTSTTSLVLSRLTIENESSFFSVPKVSIAEKEVIYKSPVYLTPLLNRSRIDAGALRAIVSGEYEKAGVASSQISSGAVIITGESARKENADAVIRALSAFAGDFVVAAAGPDMESLIAGKGSGAWQFSRKNHCRVLNLDIGGGTSNAVLFDDGDMKACGCLDIGGRLIRLCRQDEGLTVRQVSPAAALAAQAASVPIADGSSVSRQDLERIAGKMAHILDCFTGADRAPSSEDLELMGKLQTPGSSPFPVPEDVQTIFFSGGVAEMMLRPAVQTFAYGDIGMLLADAVQQSRMRQVFAACSAGETIRATVVGAGSYTTSISGSTVYFDREVLPVKNVPVIRLDEQAQREIFRGNEAPAREIAAWHQQQQDICGYMLAMEGMADPDYGQMKAAAAAISRLADQTMPGGEPLLLAFDRDIAKAMGLLLRGRQGSGRKIICIDSVHMRSGEFADLGRPLMDGLVIPVVVKTLVFE